MTECNMMYVLLRLEIFIERGNDIRYKQFGSPDFLFFN